MKPSELLADETAWIKGESAKNSAGEQVPSFAADAVCWCVAGAFRRCYHDDYIKDASVLHHNQPTSAESKIHQSLRKAWLLKIVPHGMWWPEWQDAPERTHAEVISALKAVGE